MKKHNGNGNRSNERRKPTKERLQHNQHKREQDERMRNYETVCDTWNALATMHNTNNEALAGVVPIAKIIGNPEVLEKMTPEAKKELALASKNLLTDVQNLKQAQVQMTQVLEELRPSKKVNPEDPDREMENLTLLAHGEHYQDWAGRYQTTVLPGIATCLDLVNSCLPEDQKVGVPATQNETVKENGNAGE